MWEIPAANVRISARLGRGAYGGLFDAEITLLNGQFARALVKVRHCIQGSLVFAIKYQFCITSLKI